MDISIVSWHGLGIELTKPIHELVVIQDVVFRVDQAVVAQQTIDVNHWTRFDRFSLAFRSISHQHGSFGNQFGAYRLISMFAKRINPVSSDLKPVNRRK